MFLDISLLIYLLLIVNKANSANKFGEKSNQKCREYGEFVYSKATSPLLLIDDDDDDDDDASNKEPGKVNDCAMVKASLILHGEPTVPKEFPHMAQIGYYYQDNPKNAIVYNCAGTLISKNFILTAAHCLTSSENGDPVHVRLGEINTKVSDTDILQVIKVGKMFPHPKYVRDDKYHDIGLIQLESDANFTPFVRPTCLNTNRVVNTTSAIATGWGVTEKHVRSDILLKVKLELINYQNCSTFYPPKEKKFTRGLDKMTQMCAGPFANDNDKDTCQGDSGGPLQIYTKEVYCMYTQIGVTSFGTECGIVPGVYTNVVNYIDWIEKIVWP